LIYIHPGYPEPQELAPFGFSEGCQRVIEPVSHRFCINQLQGKHVIDWCKCKGFSEITKYAVNFGGRQNSNVSQKP